LDLALNSCAAAYPEKMTVLEVIQRATTFLAKKEVDSPRLQAELLLAHVLAMPRMQLYLNFERALTTPEQDTLRELIKRRGGREPLQHIIGSTSFCGLEIQVNRHALVPRPETELLAEQGWLFLNQCADGTAGDPHPGGLSDRTNTPKALDFGTGSGCVAVCLAVKCPAAAVFALDVSTEALDLAKSNAARHGVINRIEFVHTDGLSAWGARSGFLDLLIANPPYIPTGEIQTLEPEVREHDPRVALDGGPDGLDFFRSLAGEGGSLLKPAGKLMIEFGDGQELELKRLFERENWIVERILSDYTQRPRILIARKKA
jgi:release factor glutamine methyltransferase